MPADHQRLVCHGGRIVGPSTKHTSVLGSCENIPVFPEGQMICVKSGLNPMLFTKLRFADDKRDAPLNVPGESQRVDRGREPEAWK